MLPVRDWSNVVTLGEGSTPLLEASRLGRAYGIDRTPYDELLPVMAAQALGSGSPANNPRVPTADEIIELYQRVYD